LVAKTARGWACARLNFVEFGKALVAARSAAFLISEVCDGQVVLRPRGTQIRETLDTLVIGVCGIFNAAWAGGCVRKNGDATEAQGKTREVLLPLLRDQDDGTWRLEIARG
jgi:hypothetical protein